MTAAEGRRGGPARPWRERWSGLQPLNRLTSLRAKLAVLVCTTIVVSSLAVFAGLHNEVDALITVPLAIILALLVAQVLARGMARPLAEMTQAASAMATGDYSRRVHVTSRDEVGQLAQAFNRMAEDLASVDRQRRELVANVSHELRTPVSALRAVLENIMDGVSEPSVAMIGPALEQTQRLGRLIEQLLDLSRLEAGAASLDVGSLVLRPFLESAVRSAGLVGRRVTYRVDVRPEDLCAEVDAERLHQAVANLLHNAARHSPAGGEVTVGAFVDEGMIVLAVHDTGPGIDPTQRERVFERFHRGAQPTGTGNAGSTPSGGGTGLGLAIARWAVQLHGGTIRVADSAVGCRMEIRLPQSRVTKTADRPLPLGAIRSAR